MKRVASLLAVTLLVFVACAPPPGGGSGERGGQARPQAPKVLRATIQREPHSFVLALTGGSTTAGGAPQVTEIAHNYLAFTDGNSTYQPGVAEALPSIERGTWKLLPDGAMETTWKLRTNVRWHDGRPFTADDVVFGWEVFSDANLPLRLDAALQSIDTVTAVDQHTVLVRWKRPYPEADGLVRGTLEPLPRWILGDALRRADADAFLNHPYLTTEWVGLGPFKLVSWSQGSHIEFARFDAYFRGPPKLDGLVLRFIPDPNTMIANILSEEVDLVLPLGVGVEGAKTVEERWIGTKNQVLVAQNGRIRFGSAQFRPDSQLQPALFDPRVRRAMYQAIDRQALVDAVILGYGATADSFIPPDEPMRKDVESAIPQYRYDLEAAARALADLGWTRGSDGVLRNREGRPFEFVMQQTASGRSEVEQNVTVDGWKQLGIRIEQRILAVSLQADEETRARFPGVEISAVPYTSFLAARIHSKFSPTPQTRWRGSNRGSYANARVDEVLDRLLVTIPRAERLQLVRDLLRESITDLALFPLYWDPDPILALAHVKNIPMPTARTQVHTWNVWEWDVT